jgi:hypothetical protein
LVIDTIQVTTVSKKIGVTTGAQRLSMGDILVIKCKSMGDIAILGQLVDIVCVILFGCNGKS